MKCFYAYMWLREDGTPYYVGKGKGNRGYSSKPHHRPPKDRSRILIFERNSEREAFDTEKELIRNWGRKDNRTGILINCTSGGIGGATFTGRTHTEGARKKISEARKGVRFSVEHRHKLSVAKIGTAGNRTGCHEPWSLARRLAHQAKWGDRVECHPERKHFAKGLCRPCYKAKYDREHK